MAMGTTLTLFTGDHAGRAHDGHIGGAASVSTGGGMASSSSPRPPSPPTSAPSLVSTALSSTSSSGSSSESESVQAAGAAAADPERQMRRMESTSSDASSSRKPSSPVAGKHLNQALAALAVSFGPFAVGLGKGYTSPALASMQSGAPTALSTLEVTAQQGSWVASLSLLGALFGGLFSGMVMKHGRRRTFSYVTLPFAASWTLTMFASCVEMIYLTAFLVGFFSAIIQLATQVYISEIAHPDIRASLCSASKILSHVGLLVSFALGAWLDWRQLACVCAGAPIMLFITSRFVPETPSFLLYTNQEEEAEKALKWLRGGRRRSRRKTRRGEYREDEETTDEDVSAEMATIHSNIRRAKEDQHDCRAVLVPRLLRPLGLTCGLMLFHRFSGVAAFNFYAVTIFQEASSSFNPHLAAVTVGAVQLVASIFSGVLADLVGRLPLLVVSTALMSVALAGFGCFAYYREYAPVEAAVGAIGASSTKGDGSGLGLDWIPLVCVVLFVCAFSLGVNPISWLLVGEVFPLEYRSVGPPVATAFSYVCAFVAVKTFVDLRDSVGLHGTFWTYSATSVVGLAYCLAFVPETKGTTLDEMEPKDEGILRGEQSGGGGIDRSAEGDAKA